jgi:hypothetical protein
LFSLLFLFFSLQGYGINSILYQRGIYPPDEFKVVKKYGLNMLITTNVTLDLYLKNVLTQLSGIILLLLLHSFSTPPPSLLSVLEKFS